jgi:hypothetical protein
MADRLKNATSPYLLQHADNPVDWWPWSPEAFAAARERDVPVMLSVGYSACHWCHVMAHESFEDPQTAMLLNDNLVSIKVDREERPDVGSCSPSRRPGGRTGTGSTIRPAGSRPRWPNKPEGRGRAGMAPATSPRCATRRY